MVTQCLENMDEHEIIQTLPQYFVDQWSQKLIKKFKFIDLFAGIGGMRIPFEELGGECVFTSEIDKFAQQTYEANLVTPNFYKFLFV